MKVYMDILKIKGSHLGEENPLPIFKSIDSRVPIDFDGSFTSKDEMNFGDETGFRILPYRMQDQYRRTSGDEVELKTAVLENDKMRAVFLPEYGGRLASLYDKNKGKELLFKNPVFQPANLAQRNAWFSGGIEWNIGRFGHSVMTSSALYFASLTDDDGNQFLRAYEYERVNKVFFSIDFHLPAGAEQLGVHVRIINDNKHEVPMYWWTNIAVREEKNLRVLSSTDEVIYMKPEANQHENSTHEFGKGRLGELPILPGKDPSYPQEFNFSSEYFFQTAEDQESPWEAASYNDGFTFFERSTSMLRYRKMFCWGMHSGGRNWCDYLSERGRGDYVEIQAGLAPTQVHGLKMPAGAEWTFSQFFGSYIADKDEISGSWDAACEYSESQIDSILSSEEVNKRNRLYAEYSLREPDELIHIGSGWGALETIRRRMDEDPRPLPVGMVFPEDSLAGEQSSWLNLLEHGDLRLPEGLNYPLSWMVDPAWEPRLKKSAENDGNNPWPLIYLGVLYYETGRTEKAVEAWRSSLALEQTSLAWRNIAIADGYEGNAAVEALLKAVEIEGTDLSEAMGLELLNAFNAGRRYQEAWEFFSNLPESMKDHEKIAVAAAESASELGNDDYLRKVFKRSLAYIKEGETRLVEYWYKMHARRIAREKGVELDESTFEEAVKTCPPPREIDFMMV